jgi:hypothetical protein
MEIKNLYPSARITLGDRTFDLAEITGWNKVIQHTGREYGIIAFGKASPFKHFMVRYQDGEIVGIELIGGTRDYQVLVTRNYSGQRVFIPCLANDPVQAAILVEAVANPPGCLSMGWLAGSVLDDQGKECITPAIAEQINTIWRRCNDGNKA